MTDKHENKLISRLSMVTFLGDHISFFAILLILERAGISPEYSGTSIIFQAFAYTLASVFYPLLSSNINTKYLLILSQFASLITSTIILYLYKIGAIYLEPFIACTFILTFLYQIFDSTKNHHSKLIGVSDDQHVSNEIQLLKYLFAAQTVGPMISIGLINFFPLWVPLFIDILTFIVCIIMALRLTKLPLDNASDYSFLKPFKYIWNFPKLRDITLLRSFGFWFGAGIFDFLIFPWIRHKYNISITNIAWFYVCLGAGGSLGTALIQNPLTQSKWLLGRYQMWQLAIFGNIGMSLTMIFFWITDSVWTAAGISVVHGLFMGILAGSTQSIRKLESTDRQFPEIISMEIMIGRFTATVVPWILFKFLTRLDFTYEDFRFIPAVSSFCLAIIYFYRFGIRYQGK